MVVVTSDRSKFKIDFGSMVDGGFNKQQTEQYDTVERRGREARGGRLLACACDLRLLRLLVVRERSLEEPTEPT